MTKEFNTYPTSRVELRTKRGISDFKFIIELPFDLTAKEAQKVKDYLDTMVGQRLEDLSLTNEYDQSRRLPDDNE
jgi:hypothetical protein